MKNFLEFIEQTNLNELKGRIAQCSERDIERALAHEHVAHDDIPALFSAAAEPYLELMAQRSAAMTRRRFGKVIQLYAPLYMSNECVNRCLYCGFAHQLEIPRSTLTPEEVIAEAQILYDEGFRHILLVSGESRRHTPMDYLVRVARALHERFSAIAIEIHPLTAQEYRQMNEAGVDGLAIYQETYDPERYRHFHPAGPKRNFAGRLAAIEHGGEAGMRSLGIGALLGLNDWRFEATMLAWHGRFLAKKFWQSRVAVSFPRIREAAGHYRPECPVSDRNLVQMMCAMRLAMPDAELVLSTREPAALRDRLIGLGITRLSAGSKTNPGGYSHPGSGGQQFEVSDSRGPEEMARVIKSMGYEPVWKDFDREFIAPDAECGIK